jgi:hypothetical protein
VSAIRAIALDELRDAVAELAQVEISDGELARLGVPLTGREVLWAGLGPSAYTVVDVAGGAQYVLHRLDYDPGLVNVAATLTAEPATLIEQLVSALQLSADRVRWRESDELWLEALASYDRDAWLRRVTAAPGSSDRR